MSNQSFNPFDEILNRCLDMLHQGGTVAECIKQFPEWEAELLPILEITTLIEQVEFEPISEAASLAGEAHMLKVLEQESFGQKDTQSLASFSSPFRFLYQLLFSKETNPMTRITRSALASLLLVFSFFFTLNASADSLPGDILYPIKTISQQTRIRMAAPEAKTEVLAQVTASRIAELDQLMIDGRGAIVTFDGPVTIVDEQTIMVEGFEIELTADTLQHVEFSDDDFIQITVELANGTLTALEIDASEIAPIVVVETPTAEPTIDPTVTVTQDTTNTPEPPASTPAVAYPYPSPEPTETETQEPTVTPEPPIDGTPEAYPYPSPEPTDDDYDDEFDDDDSYDDEFGDDDSYDDEFGDDDSYDDEFDDDDSSDDEFGDDDSYDDDDDSSDDEFDDDDSSDDDFDDDDSYDDEFDDDDSYDDEFDDDDSSDDEFDDDDSGDDEFDDGDSGDDEFDDDDSSDDEFDDGDSGDDGEG